MLGSRHYGFYALCSNDIYLCHFLIVIWYPIRCISHPSHQIRCLCHTPGRGCHHAQWGIHARPGTRSTSCSWSSHCAIGAPQRRCTCCLQGLKSENQEQVKMTDEPHKTFKTVWESSSRNYHWWGWCRKHTSWHTGCRSSWGNRRSRL